MKEEKENGGRMCLISVRLAVHGGIMVEVKVIVSEWYIEQREGGRGG